jgi:uncharacterized protein YycO
MIAYDAIRPRLTTGCAVLWKGNGLLSRAIRLFSEFSHASLIVRLDEYQGLKDRVFLVEALATGLELRLLSERITGYDDEIDIFTPRGLGLDQQDAVRDFALVQCAKGVPYAYGSLFANILGHVCEDAHKYFCSEFVWAAWLTARVVTRRPDNTAPRPGDIPLWCPGGRERIAPGT